MPPKRAAAASAPGDANANPKKHARDLAEWPNPIPAVRPPRSRITFGWTSFGPCLWPRDRSVEEAKAVLRELADTPRTELVNCPLYAVNDGWEYSFERGLLASVPTHPHTGDRMDAADVDNFEQHMREHLAEVGREEDLEEDDPRWDDGEDREEHDIDDQLDDRDIQIKDTRKAVSDLQCGHTQGILAAGNVLEYHQLGMLSDAELVEMSKLCELERWAYDDAFRYAVAIGRLGTSSETPVQPLLALQVALKHQSTPGPLATYHLDAVRRTPGGGVPGLPPDAADRVDQLRQLVCYKQGAFKLLDSTEWGEEPPPATRPKARGVRTVYDDSDSDSETELDPDAPSYATVAEARAVASTAEFSAFLAPGKPITIKIEDNDKLAFELPLALPARVSPAGALAWRWLASTKLAELLKTARVARIRDEFCFGLMASAEARVGVIPACRDHKAMLLSRGALDALDTKLLVDEIAADHILRTWRRRVDKNFAKTRSPHVREALAAERKDLVALLRQLQAALLPMATAYMDRAQRAMTEGAAMRADPDKSEHIDKIAYALAQVAGRCNVNGWAAKLATARAQLEQPEPPGTASVATQTEA